VTAGFVPSDQAVRDEIRESLGENLLVEAGAGTGKTTVLVDRIVEALRRGRAGVDEIVVMTFTEKAAAELAARVRQGLEEALAAAEPDSEEAGRVRLALQGLYRARIETIHAFATNVLRERPVEARLDPGFDVLDELTSELAFDEVYEEWLTDTLEGDDDTLTRALNRGFDLDEMRAAAEALHSYRYVLPLAELRPARPRLSGFVERLSAAARRLGELEPACVSPEEDRGVAQIPQILAFDARCATATGDDAELERIVLFRAPRIKAEGAQKHWGDRAEDCVEMKKILGELGGALDELRDTLRTEALCDVLPLVQEFVARYEERRRRDGQADFDDLLIWTRNLLRDRLEVRGYFQRRYACVFVDEFQDTDPIQAEIVMYLVSDGSSPESASGDWRDLEPVPGKLFVVGDPKQSIYRFRRADIGVYDDVKRGPLGGGLRQITQNFRSGSGVLSWVNEVFDRVLVEKPGIQPPNIHLVAEPSSLELARVPVVVVHGSAGGNGQGEGAARRTAAQIRDAEADALAALIQRAVEVEHWPVRDRRTDEMRPCSWRDVAMLVPSRTEIDWYEKALAKREIPYRMEGTRTFFHREEVRQVVSLLHAIDDPTDQVSLVGALRSGAFGCSDEEVFLWEAAGHGLDYRRSGGDSPGAVAEAMAMLHSLHRARLKLSLPELVRGLLEDTGLVEFWLTRREGDQAAANLLKVVEQARAYAGSGGGGLRSFARWLARHRDTEIDEADAGVTEDSDDIVRLLTIHSAKGLEFPIVALANLNTPPRAQGDPIPDPSGRGLHLRVGTKRAGHFKTPGFDDAVTREKEQTDAERRRLLYVAATRARDHLVVPLVVPPDERKGMLSYLAGLVPEWQSEHAGRDVDGCHVYDPAALAAAPETPARTDEPVLPAEVDAEIARRQAFIEEHLSLVRSARREPAFHTATSVERAERPLVAGDDAAEGLVAYDSGPPLPIGDALHETMERVSLPDASDLEAVATAACAEAGVLDWSDDVLRMARNCLTSPVMERAMRSDAWYREVPFTVPTSDVPGFTTGRMDLVFREDGELVIVDFKSDHVQADRLKEAAEAHRGQATAYAESTASATGLPVREVVFVFARPGSEAVLTAHPGG